jgi:uncharacterized protein
MPERDVYIPGVPCWVDTSQPDPDAVLDFYGGLFGWELEDAMPPGSDGRYLYARLRGLEVAGVGSIPEGGPQMALWNSYIAVESADETAVRVADAGGTALMEPFDVLDAGRMAVFADHESAVFFVWQAKGHIGARLVNEPGSLNFNGLHTRDVEAAKAFYGAVFGWQTLDLGGGAMMWTLPGYGDHLEERSPGLRKLVAEMGGPPGFEDVVASLSPVTGELPPHWSVTFASADADADAAKATELGGSVVVPPFDAPWVRMTVLADPQGATFTASQFVAENRS